MAETKPVQSLLRGIDLLNVLIDAPEGMRLNDLAETMNLKVPTVHNLVRTLAQRGLVEKRNGTFYAAGPGLLEMAGRLRANSRHTKAEAEVRRLSGHRLSPVVNYTVPYGSRLAVRLRMSPDRPKIMQRPASQAHGLYGSATGLAFLAFAPHDHVMSVRQVQPFHEHGIQLWGSYERLEAFLENCRECGCAVTPFTGQELFRVAAPVRDSDGVAVAYIGASVPAGTAEDAATQEDLVGAVIDAADRLSEQAL